MAVEFTTGRKMSIITALIIALCVSLFGLAKAQGFVDYDVRLDNATYILTGNPRQYKDEGATFWLNSTLLKDIDVDFIRKNKLLDSYNVYDMRRSLYMKPSDGKIRGEPWYSFTQTYNSFYVGDYLSVRGLVEDYEVG